MLGLDMLLKSIGLTPDKIDEAIKAVGAYAQAASIMVAHQQKIATDLAELRRRQDLILAALGITDPVIIDQPPITNGAEHHVGST